MFSKDFQRVLLFIALGLVLVTIWQSWIEFQNRHAAAPSAPRSPTSSPTSSPNATATAVNPSNAAPAPSNDVPAAPTTAAPSSPAVTDGVPTSAPPAANLINVTTDLIRAQIDPQGGDLVRLELLRHPVRVDRPDAPFVLLERGGGKLFVAQSGLIGNDPNRAYPNHTTPYSAAQQNYQLGGRESLEVTLNWRAADGVSYQKIYRFARNSYRIEVQFRVFNESASAWNGFIYGQLKRVPSEEPSAFSLFGVGGLPSYHGAAVHSVEENYEKIDYSDMRESSLNLTTADGWVAMLQRYFVAAYLPRGASQYQLYTGVNQNAANPDYRIGYKSTQPTRIPSGGSGALATAIYAGPKEQTRLEKQAAEGLLLTVDYGFLTPIADPLFWLLARIHAVVGNWGWAIILLTLLVKAVFYPLSAASYKSMARMRKLQPRLQTLKERYGDDRQKFQQEMMKLYKTEKVNPAGGCLPMLVQIPVFIALYWTLLESVELRQAPFIFWIQDLSIPDPFYVLPLVMGGSMLVQFKLNPAPVEPMQKRIMMAMPIVFTVFFLWFPSGLVLYWVVNNLLSIAQQYYITRKYAAI